MKILVHIRYMLLYNNLLLNKEIVLPCCAYEDIMSETMATQILSKAGTCRI